MSEYVLELKGITKIFPGVKALNNVQFQLKPGEVHVLMGENGAGKSTFIKVITGVHKAEEGEMFLNGQKVDFKGPKDAQAAGIAAVYQHPTSYPHLTVAENIFMGHEIIKNRMIQWKAMNTEANKLLKQLDADFDATAEMGTLSVAQQQMVEIAKAISLHSQLLIMDEPTSTLTEGETRKLFSVINNLKSKGISMIYISHRMEEIFEICDSYTVLRDGTFVHSGEIKEVDVNQIIEYMVGRSLASVYPEKKNKVGEVILEADHISNGKEVKDVSFSLRKGEILGFAGLVGAGRTETLKAVFGADSGAKGEIKINGKPVQIRSPRDAIKLGIGFLPEDRKKEGLVVDLPVLDNTVMAKPEKAMEHGMFSAKKAKEICQKYIRELLIKTPSEMQKAKFLSGGNQQKVVLAKWLNCEPEIIVLDEPTRGIDVNAKMEIYNIIVKLAEEGKSIIMISSEMPELIGLCDRVIVMYEGCVTGELDRRTLSQQQIMHYATGGK